MLLRADQYRLGSTPENAANSWNSRNGTEVKSTDSESGVSYCYGCKQTLEEFNQTVSKYQAPDDTADITANYNDYRGDIDDNGPAPYGNIGGDKKWPGLKKSERNVSTLEQPFYTTYWAGIDCSGLVQRAINYAQKGIVVVNVLINDLDQLSNAISSGDFFKNNNGIYGDNGKTYYISNPGLTGNAKKRFMKKINRGDLVRYNGHISIVYSNPDEEGNYEIVHASGDEEICYTQQGQPDNCSFNRKVIRNLIRKNLKSKTLKNPMGFGRIRLWE